jgi:hypothetical protein
MCVLTRHILIYYVHRIDKVFPKTQIFISHHLHKTVEFPVIIYQAAAYGLFSSLLWDLVISLEEDHLLLGKKDRLNIEIFRFRGSKKNSSVVHATTQACLGGSAAHRSELRTSKNVSLKCLPVLSNRGSRSFKSSVWNRARVAKDERRAACSEANTSCAKDARQLKRFGDLARGPIAG